MIDKAIQLETVLINFFNETENRTLDSAKAIAANGIDVLRALIDSYNSKLELYKTSNSKGVNSFLCCSIKSRVVLPSSTASSQLT